MHRHVRERAGIDATATGAGRDVDDVGRSWLRELESSVTDVSTIAPEGCRRTIKDGRVAWRIDIETPFPIGEVAYLFVSGWILWYRKAEERTIIATSLQLLLVGPDEIAVPSQEGTLK